MCELRVRGTRALSDWSESESALGFIYGRIFCGKPVPTFPENALTVASPTIGAWRAARYLLRHDGHIDPGGRNPRSRLSRPLRPGEPRRRVARGARSGTALPAAHAEDRQADVGADEQLRPARMGDRRGRLPLSAEPPGN